MGRYKSDPCSSAGSQTKAARELLEWAASFSPRAKAELRRLQWAEADVKAKARRERELLEWLAKISETHELKLRNLLREEAEERESQERSR